MDPLLLLVIATVVGSTSNQHHDKDPYKDTVLQNLNKFQPPPSTPPLFPSFHANDGQEFVDLVVVSTAKKLHQLVAQGIASVSIQKLVGESQTLEWIPLIDRDNGDWSSVSSNQIVQLKYKIEPMIIIDYVGEIVDGDWHGKGIMKIYHQSSLSFSSSASFASTPTSISSTPTSDAPVHKGDKSIQRATVQSTMKNVQVHLSRYDGHWSHGEFHGEGVLEWSDGSKYSGFWDHGLRHTTGTMRYPIGHNKNRLIYVGEWTANNRGGLGTLSWRDGSKYEGHWSADVRQGWGEYTWPNGKIFAGHWRNGNRHGLGMISTLSEPPKYDIYADDQPTFLLDRLCSSGTISQMKLLLATLSSVPAHHRAVEYDRCEHKAVGIVWSNENVLHALRGHALKDEL